MGIHSTVQGVCSHSQPCEIKGFLTMYCGVYNGIPYVSLLYILSGNEKAFLIFKLLKFAVVILPDETADIKSLDIPVNAVATALKQFFNDLTEPLIPTRLHDELTEASGM